MKNCYVCSKIGDNETEEGIIRIGQSLVGTNKNLHWAILNIIPLKNK